MLRPTQDLIPSASVQEENNNTTISSKKDLESRKQDTVRSNISHEEEEQLSKLDLDLNSLKINPSRGIIGYVVGNLAKYLGRTRAYDVSKMSDEDLDILFKVRIFDNIQHELNTGDIILCRGTEGFSSRIRWGTMCTWSHVAMIVRDPSPKVRKAYGIDGDKFENESVFIFESDTETHPEVNIYVRENGKSENFKRKESGTQMIPLKLWLETSIKDIGDSFLTVTRQLQYQSKSHDKHYSDAFKLLESYMINVSKAEYEISNWQMIKSAFGLNSKEDMTTIFCSELVAGALKCMGILCKCSIPNNFIPRDFTSDQRWLEGDFLVHLEDFSYTEEIRIRLNRAREKEAMAKHYTKSMISWAVSGLALAAVAGVVVYTYKKSLIW